jgi:hypothetical protein
MDLVSYEELIGDVNENEMGHGGGTEEPYMILQG